MLQQAGYTVDSAESGDDAMALLEVEKFDLVLLGRRSRDAITSIAQRLREKYPDLLTLKIESENEEGSAYASRITDPAPKRVLSAVREMLGEHIRRIATNGLDSE
jgi:CheY-like chemotaxis protein